MTAPEMFVDGLDFGEGPRWHDDRLFYSDFFQGSVFAVTADGARERVCDVPGQPSGLGWLPDGRMLVVSMLEERIYRLEPDGSLVVHSDISDLAIHCNDMVVAADGTAYVGHFGFEFFGREQFERRPGTIVGVHPDGRSWTAAEVVEFPNGSVITADGRTLIVGETVGRRYTAFPIERDGSLRAAHRRVWAEVPDTAPDGCTLDADDGIWFADATRGRVLRVVEGGEITDTIETPMRAFACALGGADGRDLYIVCAPSTSEAKRKGKAEGAIYVTRVDAPHAGLP
jgi:sugar lactone lactonase YvrE